jgi:hypothetical protein
MSSRFQVAPKHERTVDNICFDSKKEAKRYAELKLLERAGHIKDLMLQTKFPVAIEGQHFCNYSADFVYYDLIRGRTVVEDIKSTGTASDAAYKLRKKAAEIVHKIKVEEVIR